MSEIPVTPDAKRRALHYADKGKDVRAFGRMVARALAAHGVATVNKRNGVFGHGLLVDTMAFQSGNQLVADGVVGPATWHAIDPYMHAYERLLLKFAPKPKPVPNGVKVNHQMHVMLALGLSFYGQWRPAATTIAEWIKRGGDCSGSYLLAKSIALAEAWDGYGFTGTMWHQGIAVSEADVEIGDCIFYGSNGITDHVACVSDVGGKLAIGFGAVPGHELDWFYRPDFLGFRRLA